MKRSFPPILLLWSALAMGASPSDSSPVFSSQILNQAGTAYVDPNARSWNLSASTDSIAVTALAPTNDITATGSLTSGASIVTLALNGQASLNVEISGTWSGTIVVNEPGSVFGHTLYAQLQSTSALAPSITANGNYRIVGLPTNGSVTVAFSSYTSGTATVTMRASVAQFIMQSYQLNAANLLTSSWLSDGAGSAIGSNSNYLNVNTKQPSTANSPANSSVGVTSASLLAANSARKGLVVTNLSANIVSFGIGAAAVLNSGITLLPGGVWTMDEFSFSTAAINAIAGAAASSVAVQEFQ